MRVASTVGITMVLARFRIRTDPEKEDVPVLMAYRLNLHLGRCDKSGSGR